MTALAAIPSASVALVISRSATHGVRNGFAVSAGIVAGDLIFVLFALLGMTFLAETMGAFFALVKYIAGAYLIWLGLTLLLAKTKDNFAVHNTRNTMSLLASYMAGFFLTLGDIKAIFFYASLFPIFVDLMRLQTIDVALIITVTVVAVGGTKMVYAVMAERIAKRLQRYGRQRVARSVAGCMMTGAGAFLISKS